MTVATGHYPFPSFPAEQENDFRRHYNESNASVAWSGAVLGEGIYLGFYFWDIVIDSAHSTQTLLVRLSVGAWIMIILLLPHSVLVKHLQGLFAITAAIAGIGIAVIISLLQDGLNVGLSGIVLTLMFNFGFLRLLFIPSLASGMVICFAYNVASIVGGLAPSLIVANNCFLAAAVFAGATITYLLEKLFRTQFLTEKALARDREILARQSQSDTRHLAWLRQLAQFLRHEVRQPVAQINSSIEIIQLACKNDNLAPYLASAALGTQYVWNLIERASRATDAEAFVRQGQPQWTDLQHLVAEQVQACRQSNTGIDFELQCVTPIRVYADPTLMKEAVSNLLGNAVSFANEGSTVEVALVVNGAHVVITVRNKGPSIETDDCERLFGLFASTRSGPSSEHQGLGLYLVRLIAEQHGGTATIANLDDGSGVQASILLPLAVPASRFKFFLSSEGR